MDFFKINGKDIKPPKEITVSPEVLDKSERTADGTLVVDIIGTKRKVDLSWEYMSQEDMARLQSEIGGGAFSEIAFHDNATGEILWFWLDSVIFDIDCCLLSCFKSEQGLN